MTHKQDNWQRIEGVITWANMSTNYFARHIGLPRGENLYQIKRGNNGISLDVATKIVDKFPQISKLWLLTGDGKMFAEDHNNGAQTPYFNIDMEQGLRALGNLTADYDMFVPQMQGADLAMLYTNRDMEPDIPRGTVVFLQKIDPEVIIPGEDYAVVTQKIVTLRYVRAAEDSNHIRLVAANRERYDDILLDMSDLESVYKVCGKLIVNT